MKKNVHVWHVEITDSGQITPPLPDTPYELRRGATCLPELNRMLYVAVGAQWLWYERLGWSYQKWQRFLSRPNTQTWVAYNGATPVGYFELEAQPAGAAEICYFGLLPEFIGKGFGGHLLRDAIDKAWQLGGKRIWLHTCTLDHPRALPNYQARGFQVFKEEDIVVNIPDEAIQPWQGANKPTTPEGSPA